jgi:protein TonB
MRRLLLSISLAIHLAILFGLFVAGAWKLDRLDPGKHHIDLAVALPPPPAPAGGPPAAVPVSNPKRHITHDLVIPTRRVPEAVTTSPAGSGEGSGSGSGRGSGDPGEPGDCTTDCGPGPAAPEPRKPVATSPTAISPVVLRGLRIAGETQLHPPDPVKIAMVRDGKTTAVAGFQVCLAATGEVSRVTPMKSSGYAAYDAVLTEGLRAWRYRPYLLNGRGIPVCGMVTFIYSIK